MQNSQNCTHCILWGVLFLSFYVWGVVSIMWMLSLATGHFSHTFIKKLEWQYLGAIHREAYNTKPLLFCWNHYFVLGWDTSGQCFEDHWWIMTKWVFTETIWASSCTSAPEQQVWSSGRNLHVTWGCCLIDFGTKQNNHVLVKEDILQWLWGVYGSWGV